MNKMSKLRDFIFQCRYLFRGFPAEIGGKKFRLDESLRRWKLDGEAGVTKAINDCLREGDQFIDVGANFGLHTLYAARKVGTKGRVHAFEPVLANLRLLRRNVKLSGVKQQVIIIPRAVSNSSAPFLEMDLPDEGLAVAASLSHGSAQGRRVIHVPNTRLDDCKFDFNMPLRMLKVDVEGAEMEVLRGGQALLLKHHPWLLVEVHGYALPAFSSSAQELSRYLTGLGYQERRLSSPSDRGEDYYQSLFEPV